MTMWWLGWDGKSQAMRNCFLSSSLELLMLVVYIRHLYTSCGYTLGINLYRLQCPPLCITRKWGPNWSSIIEEWSFNSLIRVIMVSYIYMGVVFASAFITLFLIFTLVLMLVAHERRSAVSYHSEIIAWSEIANQCLHLWLMESHYSDSKIVELYVY